MATYFRLDQFTKTSLGPAIPGAQIYLCNQPANTASLPPSPLASIFSDPNGLVPIVQPLLSDGFGHTALYVAPGLYTLVVGLNGKVQQVYPDQSAGDTGTGSNSTSLVAGANILIVGNVISAVVPGGVALQTNSVANTLQSLLNLKNGSGITLASDGAGGVTITNTNPSTVLPSGLSSVTGLGNWKGITANFNAATFSFYGSSGAPTMTNNVQVNATATEINMVGFHTTVTPSTIAGMNAAPANSNVYTIGSITDLQCRLQLAQTTNVRVWIVWTNTNVSNPNAFMADNPNTNLVGFRYSTNAGDTKWICYAGTSNVNFTAVAESTATHVGTTGHTFAIKFISSGTVANYYIDDTLVGTISTNMPATSQAISPCVFIDNVATGNDQQVNLAYMSWLGKL